MLSYRPGALLLFGYEPVAQPNNLPNMRGSDFVSGSHRIPVTSLSSCPGLDNKPSSVVQRAPRYRSAEPTSRSTERHRADTPLPMQTGQRERIAACFESSLCT